MAHEENILLNSWQNRWFS